MKIMMLISLLMLSIMISSCGLSDSEIKKLTELSKKYCKCKGSSVEIIDFYRSLNFASVYCLNYSRATISIISIDMYIEDCPK